MCDFNGSTEPPPQEDMVFALMLCGHSLEIVNDFLNRVPTPDFSFTLSPENLVASCES